MKLLELFDRIDEVRVQYTSPGDHDNYNVVAHRGNVWLIAHGDENEQQVVDHIEQVTGMSDIHDGMERPDIITGQYDPDEKSLWVPDVELGHHPRASLELKKLAKELDVHWINGSRMMGMDDVEVQHSKYEMEGRVPDVLYHGTDLNALRNILRLGLQPGYGDGNWEEVGQFDAVYLAADWHKAAFHALRQKSEGKGEPVILRVKIPDRSKINPDFDAMTTLGGSEEDADELGYSGADSYHSKWNQQARDEIAKHNPGSKNLPLISGVIGYTGRIPPNHIQSVDVDLRGELADESEEPDFHRFNLPSEYDELMEALEIYDNYEQWYPGIEDELLDDEEWEDEEDEEFRENDADHANALDQTGFWGRAGAGVLFKARDTGRILFAHRSQHVEQPGTWGTWGGAIDEGENPVAAAMREAQEEAGISVDRSDVIPLYIFKHESGFRYFNFMVLVDSEFDPRLNWETQDYAWVEPGKWPQPLHFGAQDLLSDGRSAKILSA